MKQTTLLLLALGLMMTSCTNADSPVNPARVDPVPADSTASRPAVLDVTPRQVRACETIMIRGRNLKGRSDTTTVAIGGVRLEIISITDSTILAQVAAEARTGHVIVTVGADTLASESALEIDRAQWHFSRVLISLRSIMVRDSITNPEFNPTGSDTIYSRDFNFDYAPRNECRRLAGPDRSWAVTRTQGNTPYEITWSMFVGIWPGGDPEHFDSLRIRWHSAGHKSPILTTEFTVVEPPYTIRGDGSIVVELAGAELIERLFLFNNIRDGYGTIPRKTVEVLRENPDAYLVITMTP